MDVEFWWNFLQKCRDGRSKKILQNSVESRAQFSVHFGGLTLNDIRSSKKGRPKESSKIAAESWQKFW